MFILSLLSLQFTERGSVYTSVCPGPTEQCRDPSEVRWGPPLPLLRTTEVDRVDIGVRTKKWKTSHQECKWTDKCCLFGTVSVDSEVLRFKLPKTSQDQITCVNKWERENCMKEGYLPLVNRVPQGQRISEYMTLLGVMVRLTLSSKEIKCLWWKWSKRRTIRHGTSS